MINLDFADVKTIMAGMGIAMMGTGIAEGETRAMDAAHRAISSPLLEGASVQGARGVIINVTGGPDMSLLEVSEASTIIQEAAHEDANIIFGAVIDPDLRGRVKITVIATGFDRVDTRPTTTTQSTTPVDLTQYSSWTKAVEPPAAMAMPRTIQRRPGIALPTPLAMAAGAENQALEGVEEPSPLDVPAFLRRQHET
jgi:cell division protein FtsZ